MYTRRTIMTLLAGSAAVLALGALPLPALASLEDEAKDFLTTLGNQAISDLTDESVDEATRKDRFRALMVKAVDFPLVSQQVLGKYWRSADDATRQEFTVVLRESLIARFMPLFDNYGGETFDVVSTRTSTKDTSLVAATTNVFAPNGEIAKVEWYMKQTADGLRIYDFSAEGIRLTTSLQDEYASVVRRANGDINVLIDEMKKKLPPDAELK